MVVYVAQLLLCAATLLVGVQAGTLSFKLGDVTKDSHHSVKESIAHPLGWKIHDKAPPDHIINLQIYLPQPDFPSLERILYDISDPAHPSYGKHLSKDQVDTLVAPHPISVTSVDTWLESHGFDVASLSRSDAMDTMSLRVSVQKAEDMLKTKYYVWKHEATGDTLVRTTSYNLPTHLHAHVDLLQPTTSFSRFQPHKVISQFDKNAAIDFASILDNSKKIKANGQLVDASCNKTITVSCLKQLYNAVGVTASGKTGNEIGATGYLGQFANLNDYKLFRQNQTKFNGKDSFKVVLLNGGINNQSDPGGEANLDTQFAFGVAAPSPATFWSTGGSPPFIPDEVTPTDSNEPYADWLSFILAQRKIPQTISTSYGDSEQTVPLSFAKRVCAGFAQLGARGTSVIFSSGDGGVGDGDPNPATQSCIANDGTNHTRFLPTFPAVCPFVTGVGATFRVPEKAVSFSGGGFSNVFPRPFYQERAVSEFLDRLPRGLYKGLFNENGRGFPDVSAQGVDFLIWFAGTPGLISGTSASAPAFAGLVSLVNDVRLQRGKGPLGFLNPLLYGLRELGIFNDIETGSNPGCGTPGFNSTKGWDPVTGLGTPDIGRWLKVFEF